MVVHGLLLCKLRNAQNYSVGASLVVGSYFGDIFGKMSSYDSDFNLKVRMLT
jgi:hypothetical protein